VLSVTVIRDILTNGLECLLSSGRFEVDTEQVGIIYAIRVQVGSDDAIVVRFLEEGLELKKFGL
jgi:hypothetical protein